MLGDIFSKYCCRSHGKIQNTNNMQNICRGATGYLSWETAHCTKIQKWFDETQVKQGDLQYHFRGKESWLFCHNFARLLTLLREEGDSQKQQQTVLALSLCWVTAEGFVLGICASIDLKWKILILSNLSL